MAVHFDSHRSFRMWSYRVGHNLLLLRSVKSEQEPTRVDVLFKPVAALNLPSEFRGLRIRDADADEAASIRSVAGGSWIEEHRLFIVEGGEFTGWVLAAAVAHAEDNGEYSDPSSLADGAI